MQTGKRFGAGGGGGNIFKRTDRYRQNNGAINVPNTVIYYDIPCSVAVRGNQDLHETLRVTGEKA